MSISLTDITIRTDLQPGILDTSTCTKRNIIRGGFVLTEEKPSDAFSKPVVEQRYDLKIAN